MIRLLLWSCWKSPPESLCVRCPIWVMIFVYVQLRAPAWCIYVCVCRCLSGGVLSRTETVSRKNGAVAESCTAWTESFGEDLPVPWLGENCVPVMGRIFTHRLERNVAFQSRENERGARVTWKTREVAAFKLYSYFDWICHFFPGME